MLNINNLQIENFDYNLPKESIALYPAEKRDESKLLYYNVTTKSIQHHNFKQISDIIPENSLLIVNNTKVIAARIPAKKNTGGKAEILCIEPIEPANDPQIAMKTSKSCKWSCIIGGRNISENSILLPYNKLFQNIENFELTCKVLEKNGMDATVQFDWKPEDLTFADILNEIGNIPLPPYIERENDENDAERYQTVYAKNAGSVAAPTAGLHFTDSILEELNKKNIDRCNLTLHVGPGTFKPVSEEGIAKHSMHEEQVFVSKKTIQKICNTLEACRTIIAVGTTSLRTLESLYQVGTNLYNKSEHNFINNKFNLDQWEAYEEKTFPEPLESFKAILLYMDKNNLEILSGKTKLLIVPGYIIKTINGLITNFHLPKSTLIMLVSAFVGGEYWKEIYKTALENDYRFLSYGDSSILLK